MSDRHRRFVDTNVLVYAYDKHSESKQAGALRLLRAGMLDDALAVSTQVLGEFFTVATRRIQEPLTADEAAAAIDALKPVPVVEIDRQLVERAIQTHKRYGIVYWDALIVAAAERAGCVEVLSEDLNAGQRYGGVVVRDPFNAA